MKPNLTLLLLPLFIACTTEKSSLIEKEGFLTSLYEFNQAFAEADVSTLSNLLTESYIHTNGSSGPYNKTQWLSYVESRALKIKEGTLVVKDYNMKDIQMNFYGNTTTIVSGTVIVEGTEDGVSFLKKFKVTHTWHKENDTWKRAAFHDGKIE